MNPFTYQDGDVTAGGGAVHSTDEGMWTSVLGKEGAAAHFHPFLNTSALAFVEAYLGLEMHRAGRGGVLTCLLGRVPEAVGAGQPQKCYPGDLRDPRAWRPGGEGRRSRARCGSPTKSSSPGGFRPPHRRLCGDKGCL